MTEETLKEVMWCTVCGVRLTQSEVAGWGCPKCKNQGVPCDTAKDVCVEINWHELHILCCWAERWAETSNNPTAGNSAMDMRRTVHAIARRLQNQFPDYGQLTLSGEIAGLPTELTKAGIKFGRIESTSLGPPMLPVNGPGAVGHTKTARGTEPQPKVIDNDRDEITVTLNGAELRGWSYKDESERRVKMLCAREFVEGWYQSAKATA